MYAAISYREHRGLCVSLCIDSTASHGVHATRVPKPSNFWPAHTLLFSSTCFINPSGHRAAVNTEVRWSKRGGGAIVEVLLLTTPSSVSPRRRGLS
jgi:hypothetical protein